MTICTINALGMLISGAAALWELCSTILHLQHVSSHRVKREIYLHIEQYDVRFGAHTEWFLVPYTIFNKNSSMLTFLKARSRMLGPRMRMSKKTRA